MKINRIWNMPNSHTFKILPIKNLIIKIVKENDKVLDIFANDCYIKDFLGDIEYISNDIDLEFNTTYNLDALELLKLIPSNSIDLVLYDPPYSPRQVSECYRKLDLTVNMKTTQSSYWGNQKKEISRVLKPNGKVITCGWNSGGIGKCNGMEIKEILLVPHGGWHNDTIVTVEEKQFQ